MKKICLLISISFLLTFNANTQNFEWAKSFGGVNSDAAGSMCVDNWGSIYSTGFFQGVADFDPGPGFYNLTSVGGYDVFISKLDALGNIQWAKSFGGNGGDIANCIINDIVGNIYISGSYSNTVDFDPGIGIFNMTSPNQKAYISKLDSAGNFIWAKTLGGMDAYTSVADSLGNIYTIGRFSGTQDFDPGPGIANLTVQPNANVYVLKLDSAGNYLWAKVLGGFLGFFIGLDAYANVYSAGTFSGTADFDPGVGISNLTANNDDIFVAKLDSAGNFQWAKGLGGNGDEFLYSLAIDKYNNIYTTGAFEDTADFDPGASTFNLVSSGGGDIFVSKLDAMGNFQWAKSMGGSQYSQGYTIAVDTAANVYVAGTFNGTVDFDPGPGVYNLTQGWGGVFYEKLDSMGNFIWAKKIDSTEAAITITTDLLKNIYLVGNYFFGTDFDPGPGIYNLTPVVGNDIFLLKLNQCTTLPSSLNPVACDSYTFNGQTYTSTGIYTQTFMNNQNCDSTVTLHITIHTIDTSVLQTGSVLTANTPGASYQWISCNPFTLLPGETNQSFSATLNGDYACIISQNGCTDTSSCYNISGLGFGNYYTDHRIFISPNPSNGKFMLESIMPLDNASIEISDYLGQIIYRIQGLKGKRSDFDITSYPAGIYFVKLQEGNSARNFKIIKQ